MKRIFLKFVGLLRQGAKWCARYLSMSYQWFERTVIAWFKYYKSALLLSSFFTIMYSCILSIVLYCMLPIIVLQIGLPIITIASFKLWTEWFYYNMISIELESPQSCNDSFAMNQRKSFKDVDMNQRDQTFVVKQSNSVGTVGFVMAIVALLISWLPIASVIVWALGLLLSFIGMFKRPRGLAVAGFIISIVEIVALTSLAVAVVSILNLA